MSKAHGTHVLVDYTNFFPEVDNVGNWMLALMEQTIDESTANRVHSYVAHFDGISSPLGFAAVVLLDESHLTAHCYSERGWLSIDCFTCGSTDPEAIIDNLNQVLMAQSSELTIMKRKTENRFING